MKGVRNAGQIETFGSDTAGRADRHLNDAGTVQFCRRRGVSSSEATTVEEYLKDVAEVATIKNDSGDKAFTVDTYDGKQVLKSGTVNYSYYPSKNDNVSILTLTFKKAAQVSFHYKLDGGSSIYCGLLVEKGSEKLYTYDYKGSKGRSINKIAEGDATIEADEGDIVKISYYCGSSYNNGNKCMYLSDFNITIPNQVTFHANNGTEETSQQEIFGTGNLEKNSFSYDGHTFKGWYENSDAKTVDYADGAEITLTDNTDLYAVWAPVYKVTLDPDPSDAEVDLYSDAEHTQKITPDSGTEHEYTLEAGIYYWNASEFGYMDQNGEVKVENKDVPVKIAFEHAASSDVTFAFKNADTSDIENMNLEVWTGEGNDKHEANAEENSGGLEFLLLKGCKWNYKFTSANYSTASGEVDLTGDVSDKKTVEIELKEKTAWEGKDDIIEPKKENDVYQITSGAELAWLAQKVYTENNKYANAKAKLVTNIDLGNQTWTPIGTAKKSGFYNTNIPYKGDFDGNNKTISGLKVSGGGSAYQGLFGLVADGGSVHDLTVEGDVTTNNLAGSSGVAGIVGTLSGTKGNEPTVKNCVNKVAVAGGFNVGGIVGYMSIANIENCINEGTISGKSNVGGIVGNLNGFNPTVVKNSYNIGIVNGKSDVTGPTGGIAGIIDNSKAELQNCYTIKKPDIGNPAKPAIGKKTSGTVENIYFLGSSDENGDGAQAVSEDSLKNLESVTLGDDFCKDIDPQINNGYPILTWQKTKVDNLSKTKQEAKEKLDTYNTSDKYREKEKVELVNAIDEGKTNIDNAVDEDGVAKALKNAVKKISAIKTDAQLTDEEELETAKTNAKAELEKIDKNQYREAEQKTLADEIAKAEDAIEAATDKEAVKTALDNAKTEIGKLKTDAQYKEEEKQQSGGGTGGSGGGAPAGNISELDNAKKAAKAELAKIDKDQYRSAEQKELAEEIEKAEKAIDAAKDKTAVEKALEDAKAEIGKIKTDEELTALEKAAKAKSIAAAKAKAKKLTVKKFSIKVVKKSKIVRITWKKTKGASGYQIQYRVKKKGTKYRTLKYTTKLKYSTKKLKKNKAYKVRSRTCKKIEGKKIYGKWNTKTLKKRAR